MVTLVAKTMVVLEAMAQAVDLVAMMADFEGDE
jgi:hypothetical protein